MPDITKCTNEDCCMNEHCYRYTCEPKEFHQAYCLFEPEIDHKDDFECAFFEEIPALTTID